MVLPPALRSLLAQPDAERRLGPYHLVRQLGRGGFAPVWLAREVYGGVEVRQVAIKLFAADAAAAEDEAEALRWRARVIHEARLLCQVEHPNIVRFYRLLAEEHPAVLGLVMEHVAGGSLAERLRRQGPRPIDEALAIGAAVASALSAVHRAGLVHRDVKPANIIEASGLAKLIDFGVAAPGRAAAAARRRIKLADAASEGPGADLSTLRAVGAIADDEEGTSLAPSLELPSGTVGYLDPVCVAEGAAATAASDLYALGVTLFECVTGRLPSAAAAGEGAGLSGAVLDGRARAPRLCDIAPEAPAALGRLVDALLDPEREGRPATAGRVAVELEQLRAERAGRRRELPPEDVGPFRGLAPFEPDDRDVYFGRAAEVAAAVELLRNRGLVALIGASGSGKSSLARAGVAPALEGGALGGWIEGWDVRIATPGVDPRAAVGGALEDLCPGAAGLGPEALAAALARRADSAARGTLLVVDQLEELVTVSRGDARSWVAELLARIADPATPGVRALVAARRDLLDRLLELGALGRALQRGSLLVSPMTEAAWVEVIEQALDAYGYAFEDEALRGEILAELREAASAMPLVQFAMTALWAQRDRASRRITRAGLRAIGGLAGALHRHAEATLRRLGGGRAHEPARDERIDAARRVLLSLTTPDGTRASRALAELHEVAPPPLVDAALAELTAARLVVSEAGRLVLAHDALVAQWRTLRGWVAEAREDRLLAEEIERDTARWAAGRDASLLWRERRLAEAERLVRSALPAGDGHADTGLISLSPAAIEFVREGRSAARRRIALGVAALATSLVLGAMILAMILRSDRGLIGGGRRARDDRGYGDVVKAAALSQDPDLIAAALRTPLAQNEVRFDVSAAPLDVERKRFHYEIRPLGGSIPGGLGAVGAITYNMNHASFTSPLFPGDRGLGFTVAYNGWGCLTRVVAVIELVDPAAPPLVAHVNMCEVLRRAEERR